MRGVCVDTLEWCHFLGIIRRELPATTWLQRQPHVIVKGDPEVTATGSGHTSNCWH
jgi:hypothetical protein